MFFINLCALLGLWDMHCQGQTSEGNVVFYESLLMRNSSGLIVLCSFLCWFYGSMKVSLDYCPYFCHNSCCCQRVFVIWIRALWAFYCIDSFHWCALGGTVSLNETYRRIDSKAWTARRMHRRLGPLVYAEPCPTCFPYTSFTSMLRNLFHVSCHQSWLYNGDYNCHLLLLSPRLS